MYSRPEELRNKTKEDYEKIQEEKYHATNKRMSARSAKYIKKYKLVDTIKSLNAH